MSTPKEERFYMPAEWHPHAACWMAWPSNEAAYRYAPLDTNVAYANAQGELCRGRPGICAAALQRESG
jgi:agmatine deiminase